MRWEWQDSRLDFRMASAAIALHVSAGVPMPGARATAYFGAIFGAVIAAGVPSGVRVQRCSRVSPTWLVLYRGFFFRSNGVY